MICYNARCMFRYVLQSVVFLSLGLSLFAQNNTMSFDTAGGTGTSEIILSRNPGNGVYDAVIEGETQPSPAGYFEIYNYNGSANGSAHVSFKAEPPITSGRLFAEVQAPSTVGVAFSNPGAVPAALSFFFTGP